MPNTVAFAMRNMISLSYDFICVRCCYEDGIFAVMHNPSYSDVMSSYGDYPLVRSFISYKVLYIDVFPI